MDSQLWLVAIKGDESPALLESKTKDLCAHMGKFPVPVPGLRVGTLDSLMSLSDDLVKMDSVAESTTFKLLKQLTDLKPREQPTVSGVPLYNYATSLWEWDEAKFQLKTPLRELSESIAARLGGMDDELKTKLAELNVLKGAVAQAERKQQGNLMVRGLADLVKEEDVIESDSMTTLLVVVPKSSDKEFLAGYMGMARFVVPHSAKQARRGSDAVQMQCQRTLTRAPRPRGRLLRTPSSPSSRSLSSRSASTSSGTPRGKSGTRSATSRTPRPRRRRTPRRQPARPRARPPHPAGSGGVGLTARLTSQRRNDEAEADRLKGLLANWLQINFAEAYSMMMHLKASSRR